METQDNGRKKVGDKMDREKGTLGAGIAQSVVCWARCPAQCSIVDLTLL